MKNLSDKLFYIIFCLILVSLSTLFGHAITMKAMTITSTTQDVYTATVFNQDYVYDYTTAETVMIKNIWGFVAVEESISALSEAEQRTYYKGIANTLSIMKSSYNNSDSAVTDMLASASEYMTYAAEHPEFSDELETKWSNLLDRLYPISETYNIEPL